VTAPRLTVGITTRNRPAALARCLASMVTLAHLEAEVLVFDDGSQPPAAPPSDRAVRVLRDIASPGYIVGRNRLVREAAAPFVLLLDDDAVLLSSEPIERAIALLEGDGRVAAVAFAQAELDGRPWPAAMQPASVQQASVITSFIGFAHLLRRDVFLRLGGYRESFIHYGEEKDYCLRLIEAGYRTVYLPDALVVHAPDAANRSRQRYLRFVSRNDCLNALYNDPFPRVLWALPARLALYFRMRRAWRIADPWGWVWVAREVGRVAASDDFRRTPVSWATVKAWRRLRRQPAPYAPPSGGA
jgi:GT2 family glycosyltransferase